MKSYLSEAIGFVTEFSLNVNSHFRYRNGINARVLFKHFFKSLKICKPFKYIEKISFVCKLFSNPVSVQHFNIKINMIRMCEFNLGFQYSDRKCCMHSKGEVYVNINKMQL